MKKLLFFATICLVTAAFSSCKMSCLCEGYNPYAMHVNMDEQLFFNCQEMTDYYHYLGYYDVHCE